MAKIKETTPFLLSATVEGSAIADFSLNVGGGNFPDDLPRGTAAADSSLNLCRVFFA
jgi:hypothetical protein